MYVIVYVFCCCIFYLLLIIAASFCQAALKSILHDDNYLSHVWTRRAWLLNLPTDWLNQNKWDTSCGKICVIFSRILAPHRIHWNWQKMDYLNPHRQKLLKTKTSKYNWLTKGLLWISFDNSRLKMLQTHPDLFKRVKCFSCSDSGK